MLISLAKQTKALDKKKINFRGGYGVYCSMESETARKTLTDTYGRTITDAGKNCPCTFTPLNEGTDEEEIVRLQNLIKSCKDGKKVCGDGNLPTSGKGKYVDSVYWLNFGKIKNTAIEVGDTSIFTTASGKIYIAEVVCES